MLISVFLSNLEDTTNNTFPPSTRGGLASPVPFGKVVLDGYADDGGLYVPEHYPQFNLTDLRQCATYAELAFRIFRPFISDMELRKTGITSSCDCRLGAHLVLIKLGQ